MELMNNAAKTIFALSTAKGKAGVAVFRISGNYSVLALAKLMLKPLYKVESEFKPRKLYYRKIYGYPEEEVIDNAMVVYFKAPHSFTGEDVVEIHTHGSMAIINLLSTTLLNMENIHLAEAGEFAKKAFLNNKFDLTAAEGLADLIEAETKYQHKQALAQVGGALASMYNEWRLKLLTIISLLEAYIDFPDEDIPESIILEVDNTIQELAKKIKHHLDDNRRGERLRNGITLCILGAPNVGKSTLMNFLLKREISIVSHIAGTTRDVIEGHLDIGGYPIILQDTAGIRKKAADVIEEEGIKRSYLVAQNSDLKIIMFESKTQQISDSDFLPLIDENTIILFNKIDLINELSTFDDSEVLYISLKNKIGLDALLVEIEEKAKNLVKIDEPLSITRARHRKFLELTINALAKFNGKDDLILATEDIRMAMRYLGNITGVFTVEEILGEIFANFCIGK